ncbi:MAG: hypothetical protein U9Q97_07540, partial [Acidobacteriota bacterium]|nr:hypothetical protein [Acidobacteriota bacterium]
MSEKMKPVFVVLILIFVGIVFSFPLVFNLRTAIPYSLHPEPGFESANMMHGDHLQFFYTLSQFSDYLKEKNSGFFKEPYGFTVTGNERIYSPRELPLSIVFSIFSILGEITAYNLLVIFSFVACGLSVFLLSGKYMEGFAPRILGSIIFAVFPFRMAQLYGGHPNGIVVFFVPLMLYGYESWIQTDRWKYAFLSGVCIIAMGLEEFHLVYFSALFTAAFFLWKGVYMLKSVNWEKRIKAFRKLMYSLLVITIFWMVAAGYAMYVKQIVFEPSRADTGRDIAEISLFAPNPSDFLRRTNQDSERFIYPGVICLILAAFAFIKTKGQDTSIVDNEKRNAKWFYFVILL